MFDLLRVPNFIKIGANFSAGTKFTRIYNFGLRSSIPSTIFIISMFDLHLMSNFTKTGAHYNFETKSAQVFKFGSRSAISNIIFMINELDLLWASNFIALEIYFIFGTKFFWNEGIDTCLMSNMCYLPVILIFFSGYLVVTACYCSLLVVTARSHF